MLGIIVSFFTSSISYDSYRQMFTVGRSYLSLKGMGRETNRDNRTFLLCCRICTAGLPSSLFNGRPPTIIPNTFVRSPSAQLVASFNAFNAARIRQVPGVTVMDSSPSETSTAIDANSINNATPLPSTTVETEASKMPTPIESPSSQGTIASAPYTYTYTQSELSTKTMSTPVFSVIQCVAAVDQSGRFFRFAASHKLPKSLRKSRLKLARETTEFETSRILTAAIINDWDGAGLHPLQAVHNLAVTGTVFSGSGLEEALRFWFMIVNRYVALKCVSGAKFWKSIKQSRGCQARYFKAFDLTLTAILLHHWHGLLETSKEVEWDPTPLYRGLHSTFADVARWMSMPAALGTYGPELATLPPLFPNAFHAVAIMMFRRIWLVKVERVAGPHLPRELVDMIVETHSPKEDHLLLTSPRTPFVHMVKKNRMGKAEEGFGKDKYYPFQTRDVTVT